MVAAPAAVAMVWRWLFNSEFGLINNVFHTNVKWISDPKIAVFSIAIIGVWSIIGYNMVLFLSGLQEILMIIMRLRSWMERLELKAFSM